MIHLTLGEIRIGPDFVENVLKQFQPLLGSNVPVVMKFKRAYTPTGYDLEQFAKELGLEIAPGEVEQK